MKIPRKQLLTAFAVAALLATASCRGIGSFNEPAHSGLPATSFARAAARTVAGLSSGKIRHIVVIVQENRSFDDLFHGFPGADTASYGYGHGTKYALEPVSLANPSDIDHEHLQFIEDYDGGKNDGWDRLIVGFKDSCKIPWNDPSCWIFNPAPAYRRFAFAYVPRAEVDPYWELASRYALSDRTFASNNGPTFPSHQYLIAGQSNHVAENPSIVPWGCDGPAAVSFTRRLRYGTMEIPGAKAATGKEVRYAYPCYDYETIADLLDGAHVSWSYYVAANFEDFSPFAAIWNVRYSANYAEHVISPETTIFNDIAAQKLADVSWVTPSYENSDHAGSGTTFGPDWVAAVINAIGTSGYWKDTAVIVTWDEWGGWFDHFVPPQYANPQTGAYEGLGYRVPLIVVSPYAKSAYISHRQHEIASTLHFIEANFGLPSLGGADKRADALEDMFDFSQPPIQFHRIRSRFGPAFFEHQPPAARPPDS